MPSGGNERLGFGKEFCVFLFPEQNVHCSEAIKSYTGCLKTDRTIASWILESMASAIKCHTENEWIDLLIDRYLNFEKISSYPQRTNGDSRFHTPTHA